MTLLEYMRKKRGAATEIAKARGVGVSFVSQMANGTRKINAGWAMFLEQFTGGIVSRKDNYTDWRQIWPELSEGE